LQRKRSVRAALLQSLLFLRSRWVIVGGLSG
jgi:hypothetical protein